MAGGVFALLVVLLAGTALLPAAQARQLQPAAGSGEPSQAERYRVSLPMVRGGEGAGQPQQSTRALIDAAQRAGAISLEAALLLKAQALIGDPALPAAYVGAGVGADGPTLYADIQLAWPALSAAAQEQLRPYLAAPSDPTSWYATHVMAGLAAEGGAALAQAAPRLTWETIESGPFKIWYHPEQDPERSWQLYLALKDRIWPRLSELFGRSALPDCGASCAGGGGDEAVDIYLVERAGSFGVGGRDCCSGGATYAVIERRSSFPMVAHDLAAVFLAHYPVMKLDYMWLYHGILGYAMHYVYPDASEDPQHPGRNEEHRFARGYFADTNIPLDERMYDAYVYLLYKDDPALIRTLLSSAGELESVANLDAALGGKLQDEWRDFALASLNMGPNTFFAEKDDLTLSPQWDAEYELYTPGTRVFDPVVQHLGATYTRYLMDDPAIRQVRFTNPVAGSEAEGGHMWAWIYPAEGAPRVEDWAGVSQRTFCKDDPGGDVLGVVLVTSFGAWREHNVELAPESGEVKADTACTGADLTGTISWAKTYNAFPPNGEYRDSATATVEVRLAYDAEQGAYVDAGSSFSYNGTHYQQTRTTGGTVTTTTTERWTEQGGGALGEAGIGIFMRDTVAPRQVEVSLNLPTQVSGSITYETPGAPTVTHQRDDVSAVRLLCDELTDLVGPETEPGSGVFDMRCTVSQPLENGGLFEIHVSGTLTARR
jgi:hypothetical protein